MKQYKGWEIAKMISEGTLKEGELLKCSYFKDDTMKIVAHHIEFSNPNADCSKQELGSSFLSTEDMVYEIIQQPVSFMEATEKGKKIKVQHELLETCELYTHYFYLKDLMYNLANDFDNNDLKKIFLEGKWYIEESED